MAGESTVGTSVGEHLRRLRTAQGISLSALARAAGVAQPTLTRWEQGRFAPRLPELEAVLAALSASRSQRQTVLESLHVPRALARLADEKQEDPADWRAVAGARPSNGDLLRALRHRTGRMLDDVAQCVGVSTATLSRWERSDSWPDAAHLHALCYTLNAQEAEMVTLTRGRYLFTAEPTTLESLDSEAVAAQLDALHRDIVSPSAMQDLRYLALEAALWPHLDRDATALPFLYLTVSSRAGYLSAWNRLAESGAAARRAFEIEAALPDPSRRPHLSARPYPHNFGSFFFYNVIHYANTMLASASPMLWRQARRFLLEEKERCEQPDFQAWMLTMAATALKKEGQIEAALALSVQACDIARNCTPPPDADRSVEYANRRIDYARMLTRTGDHSQALQTLESAISLLGMDHESLRLVLLEVECLVGLERRSEAHDRAIQLETMLEAEPLPMLQESLAALKAQF